MHDKLARLSGMGHVKGIKGSQMEHDGHETAGHETAEAAARAGRKIHKLAGE